jgi:hypothetical protein
MGHRSPTGASPMSTLTALKLERELEVARRAITGAAEPPRLVMQWRLDPASGRPVGTWVALRATATPAAMPELAFT